MSRAIKYANLIGRYIRMERPATKKELREGSPDTVGQECIVSHVSDLPGGAVAIHSDEGTASVIQSADEDWWSFTIWPVEIGVSL